VTILQCFAKALFIQLVVATLASALFRAEGEPCPQPTAAKRAQVEGYVIARYKMPSASNVVLTDSKQANDACFWLLKYESSNPKREVTVYLSPDGNFLTPALYDVRIDPLEEQRQATEQNLKMLLAGASPELGGQDAPLTVVEFADFQCPYCKRAADTLRKDFLPAEGNHVRFLFKNYPLPMHPWAMAAAEMAECVTLQKPSEFWKVHDFLFENQTQLTADNVKDKVEQFVAANVAIDQIQYKFCVDNDLAMGPVKKEMDLGQKLGVRGTPAMFINGTLYSGFKDAAQLRALAEGRTTDTAQSDPPVPANTTGDDPPAARSACAPRTQAQPNR
jgi:protein-disulfide isomerase